MNDGVLEGSAGGGTKRKKRRSQTQMAKKFARRRDHGADVDGDTYQYMIRVLELMRAGFPTFEEKLLFVKNTYEETIGHELEYARNQVGSRVLDSLLEFADLTTIQRLADAFKSALRPLSSDRFASHVLQRMMLVCADRGNRANTRRSGTTADEEQEERILVQDFEEQQYNDIFLRLCKYFINNAEEFVYDTYANHLLRTAIECLGGLIERSEKVEGRKKGPTTASLLEVRRFPRKVEYKDLLRECCSRVRKWPQFLEFGRNELTSALVQSILYSSKSVDDAECQIYVAKVTEECFQRGSSERIRSTIFNMECSVRLLEACLVVSEPEQFSKIYEKYFAGHLRELSVLAGVNFSVQRLLDHCPTKECLEEIYEELSEQFSEICKSGYGGVLASLANACLRLQTKQGAFVKDMTAAVECIGGKCSSQRDIIVAMVGLVARLGRKEDEVEQKTVFPTTLHGSLIVQAILNFNKPIKLVNSLLEMSNEELTYLFSDPKGSRIVDAFMASKYIGEKSREKLAKKLNGCWVELAKSAHGSRSLEKFWDWAQPNQRALIMEELAAHGEALLSTKSGRIISRKMNVPLFARNKKDWAEAQGKAEKTRALFVNILGDMNNKKCE